MKDWQLWLTALVVGVVAVVVYTIVVKSLVSDPNTTPLLSDDTWLFLHFVAGIVLGILIPGRVLQMIGFIVVWEILEKILAGFFPQYFRETTGKSVCDVAFSTGGYVVGQWIRSTWSARR